MLEQFYRGVLPAQGYYALFDGPRKQHVWCDSISELTRKTEELSDRPDLYFATASFQHDGPRTIENALYRRAFCFDIDAGPEKVAKHGDKVYATAAEARDAVKVWAKARGIMPGWWVASGAGWHVYILLSEDVAIADWLPVAQALKGMARADGLKIDPGPTANAALVLRPLGALHRNGNRTVGVEIPGARYTLAELAAKTADYVPRHTPAKKSANAIFLEAPVGPPKSLVKLVKHCAAMNHAVASKGDVSEPYWRAMLGVIKHTIEGAEAAHAASEGHPDYDYAATQAKFDRWTAGPSTCALFEQENPQACAGCKWRGKVKSPITLGDLSDHEVEALPPPPPAPEPVAVAETSEWTADEGDTEEAPTARDPWHGNVPEGYRVTAIPGGFMMSARRQVKSEDVEGNPKTTEVDLQFAQVPFWFESWAAGQSDSDPALATFCVYDSFRRKTARYTMPTRNVATRDNMLGTLAAQNVQVYPSTTSAKQLMEDYVKASLERIRAAGQRQKIADRYGTMLDDDGNVVVAQGKHLISGGDIHEGVVQERLRSLGAGFCVPLPDQASGTFGEAVWANHIMPRARHHIEYLREFYDHDNFVPYQLAIMLSWASPMMAFMEGSFVPGGKLPGLGLSVSLFSPKSGIGKTAAMRAAALAFGQPTALVRQLDRANATDNARQAMLAQSGTLPVFMDEMEDVEPKNMASVISSVGNGVTKGRMTSTLEVKGGHPIALVNLMSSNKSHREIAAADRTESSATQLRMLEIECSEVSPVSMERAEAESEARALLGDCAGAVGAVIHREMARLGYKALNQLGLHCAQEARRLLNNADQDGRILWRTLGAMLAIRRMLAAVGLKVFDGKRLVHEFHRWYDWSYEFAAERLAPRNGVQMLERMLADIASDTLITLTETPRGVLDRETKFDMPLNERIPNDVKARSVMSEHKLYLRTDAVRDWANHRRYSFQTILRDCRTAEVFERETLRYDLFRGTKLAQGVRVPVYVVDMRRLKHDVVVDHEAQMGENVKILRPRPTPAQTASGPRTADPAGG